MPKPYHRNPREITDTAFEQLTQDLDDLGDVSGVVHNLETDEIIGGNMRMRVFETGGIEIIETYDKPDDQGTVAWGYVVWRGHKYGYRQVRWDEKRAARANIKANLQAGVWAWDVFANEWGDIPVQSFGLSEDLANQWNRDGAALSNMLFSEQMQTGKLTNDLGDPQPDDFWPVIKIKVSPETHQEFEKLMTLMVGKDDTAKFTALLACVKLA